jgi:xanthine dehydrogenase accessory factor
MAELSTLIPTSGRFAENVLPDLLHWRARGEEAALVTLVGIEGSGPRPVGSQMAVSTGGEWVGQITSGCAESQLVGHALEAMREKRPRLERYGRGSKYFDIQLPCGSGIDVYFDPLVPTGLLGEIEAARRARVPVALEFSTSLDGTAGHGVVRLDITGPAQNRLRSHGSMNAEAHFARRYLPPLRVVMAGRGPTLHALAHLAAMLGWSVVAASPDQDTLDALRPLCDAVQYLTKPERFDPTVIDGWSAGVLLFHDHDWEPPIVSKMLQREGFYIGALGSRQTHGVRREALRALGHSPREIEKVRGPIGLDIGARNPPELALAIASEILATASW